MSEKYMTSDGKLCQMTGVLVTIRGRNPHRSGQPQIYVWLPGQQACSVYGSIGQYAARRHEYWAWLCRHTRHQDEAQALLYALDDIVDGRQPVSETIQLVPVEVPVATEPALVRYEVRIGKWSASFSRERR